MTEQRKDGESELTLDWDDAVESFGLDLEQGVRAEAAPFPQRAHVDQPGAPKKAENERPTLPPRGASAPPQGSDAGPDSDPFALGSMDSLAPPRSSLPVPSVRLSPPPQPARSSAPTPPGKPGLDSRTLLGLAPVRAPLPPPAAPLPAPSTQRATLRPHQVAPHSAFGEPPTGQLPAGERIKHNTIEWEAEKPPTRDAAAPGHSPARAGAGQWKAVGLGDEGEDDVDATQIATVPRELLESLLAGGAIERGDRVTERPPALALEGLEEAQEDDELEYSDELNDEIDQLLARVESEPAPPLELAKPKQGAESARGLPPAPPEAAARRSLSALSTEPPEPPAPRRESSVLANLEDLAPPSPTALEPAQSRPTAPKTRDLGAQAALRTVASKKPRPGHGPLSPLDDTGKRARVGLLTALAAKQTERQRASLLITAAELHEELGQTDDARALYLQAHEAAPKMLSPLRALARLAFARGDHDEQLDWLRLLAEAAPSHAARAAALSTIARLAWLVQRDLPKALRAATEAARLCPHEPAYRALEVRILLATRPSAAEEPLETLATAVNDEGLRSEWLTFAARLREVRGERDAARALYTKVASGVSAAFEAQLALARIAGANGEAQTVTDALLGNLEQLGEGALADVVRRKAAVLLANRPEERERALTLLEDSSDPAALRSAFALASGSGDPARQERATLLWTTHSQGTEHALALLSRAQLLLRQGRASDAADALDEALAIDGSLTLAKVLWEASSAARGDVQGYLKRALDRTGAGALRSAAMLSFEPNSSAAEVELLSHANEEPQSRLVRTLLLDAHAESSDMLGVEAQLELELADTPTPGLFLESADLARRQGRLEQSAQTLQQAHRLHPDCLLIARASAHAAQDPETRARLVAAEGAGRGPRPAFANLLAGYLQHDPAARMSSFEAACEAQLDGGPASFALHAEARRQHDLARLAELHAREAMRSKEATDVASHLLRAGLVRAHEDGDLAAAQLTRALDLAPDDPVLRELVMRLGDAVPASLRAEALQRAAARARAPFDGAALLWAASAFEDAGQAEQALALYEQVLASSPEDPIAEQGRERVSRAAGRARELLEAKRRAVQSASTDAARMRALEELLQLDTDAPAEESLDRARALLVLAPQHQLALRRTERHAMEQRDSGALYDAELRLLGTSRGPKDRLARLRTLWLLTTLRQKERARADDFDQLLIDAAHDAYGGPWLARQLMSAAIARGEVDAQLSAVELQAAEASDPLERASLDVQRARLPLRRPSHEREQRLLQSMEAYPGHPTAKEVLAELCRERGDLKQAASQLTAAAAQALFPKRTARLLVKAGLLHEQLAEEAAAKQCYQRALEADPGALEAEQRLQALLAKHSDLTGLIALTEARLAGPLAPGQAGPLRAQLARLYEESGATKRAVQMLREAHAHAPDDLPTLRDLGRLLQGEKEHRDQAQVLLRIARLSRDPVELRDVFMRLGDIYDQHLPDAKRAEAAYQRALKLAPRHVPALERLAALYAREGQVEEAESTLDRLAQAADDERGRLSAAFELARLREQRGDLRGAEETLESLRREATVQPEVLRALVSFYRRQGALSALAMHLNRAVSDLRGVVESRPGDEQAWSLLVEMLEEKQRSDAARVVASAAVACGARDARIEKALGAPGQLAGVQGAGFSELLDDLVFSEEMPASTRIVFRHGAEALNKAVPFDLRAVAGERLDRKHPLRAVVQEVGRWAGQPDVEVYTTAQLPLAFVPVCDSPAQLLVGRTLLDTLTRPEQLFLSARALKIARAHMSITCRVRPEEMGLLVHGLIHSQLPSYQPPGVDMVAAAEMGRRVARHLSRRALQELGPHLLELVGAPNFDPGRVYAVASSAGNRAGLLATGSISAGLSALTKLAGLPAQAQFDSILLSRVEEARDLLSFALSEAHFEARLRAGVDLR